MLPLCFRVVANTFQFFGNLPQLLSQLFVELRFGQFNVHGA